MQFKFFVSFFPSFFSLPDKEEAPHKMVTNHPIRGVVETSSISRPIQEWVKELTNMAPEVLVAAVAIKNLTDHKLRLADIEQRVRDVNSCRITKIEHWRQGGQIAHECIILYICSPKDIRYARLDRYKPNDETSTRSSGDIPVRTISSPSGAGNYDCVKTSDKLEDLLRKDSNYSLIQSVELPPETLTVVHCAAIGASITNAAKDYSALNHMCMWWAAMFFSTAYRFLASKPPIIRGNVYEEAGRVYGIRFVTPDATLAAFTQMENVVTHAKEDSQPLLAEAVESDVKKLKSSRLVIDDIVSSSKAMEKEMRAAMEKQVEEQKGNIADFLAREANHAAELAAIAAERDAAIAASAERDAKVAAAIAERDAEIADLTSQLKSARGQGSGRRS